MRAWPYRSRSGLSNVVPGETHDHYRGPRRKFLNALAFIWGFSEATFFFIVPDVLTSRIALNDLRGAYKACLYAIVGALFGGSLFFFFGKENPGFVYHLGMIPGIDKAMILGVKEALESQGMVALFFGMFLGIPYKLYACLASFTTSCGYGEFLLYSFFARGFRFFVVTSLAGLISLSLPKSLSLRQKQKFHLWFWVSFYIFYFWKMGL